MYRTVFSATHQREAQPIYRIVQMPDENDNRLYFQIVGKSIVLNMPPQKIMRDDMLLGFSKAEIAIITHLGTKNEISSDFSIPKNKLFKIIQQIFTVGKTKFAVEKDNGEVKEYSAKELYDNSIEAAKFNGIDGMKIGYAVAEEHYENLNSLKNK